MIYGDSELKFAINSMIAWERPVIRLEIICIEEEDQSDGMAIIPDEENDLRRSEYHC